MRRPVISRSAKAREGSVVLILNSLTDNQSTCQVGIGRLPCRRRRFDVSLDGHRVRLVARTAEDRSKALAVPGVKKVVRMPEPTPPYKFQQWGGVAVVAPNTWAARCESGKWGVSPATQNRQAARTQAAETLGIDESRVISHVTFLGGAFGRKSKSDFVAEAAHLAREAKAPVRVQWTREDDLRHDYYNAVNTQLLTAALDASGKVTAWRQRTAFPPIATTFSDVKGPSAGDLQQGVTDLPLAIPNVRAETCDASAHVRVGWLRSVYNIFHGFSAGSFMDELAYARGKDPRDNLLELFGPPRLVTLKE